MPQLGIDSSLEQGIGAKEVRHETSAVSSYH